MTANLSPFSADAPIASSEEDKLGRAAFSRRLAQAIFEWRADRSLVVGVLGEWGCGKTSIVNMALEHLATLAPLTGDKEGRDDGPIVIQYNPWNWSEQHQLLRGFFTTLSAVIGRRATGEAVGKLGERLQTYARILAPAEFILGIVPGGAVPAGLLKRLGRAGRYLQEVGEALEKDLESVRQQIDELVASLGRQLVIVIDDIDRLSHEEIRQVFQLVKLNAAFPCTVYVLAFDPELVADALKPQFGRQFLEKIVQVPVEVPTPAPEVLRRLLLGELDEVLQRCNVQNDFDANDFYPKFYAAPSKYFRSLRDIRRYINSVHFTLPLVAGEINLSEFLIVEMLRIHRPHVYHRVQENRDLLVGTAQLLPPDERETYERFQRECGEEWSGISRLLQLLFPRLETLGGGTTYVASWQDRWRRDRRICTAEFFDRYFELVVPEHGIPEAEFREIWRDLESPDGLRRHFERIGTTYERTMLLLEKMEAHQGSLAAPQRAPAALALFAAGDLFAMRAPSMLSTTPNMGLLILIRQVVDPLPVDERAAVVTQAIGDGDLGTVAAFVHIQEEAAEKKRPDSLTQDQLGGMKQQVVERIRKEAEKSTLIHSPHFHYLVWPWEKWGGDTEEVARYVREAVADDEKLPLTLELFVSDVFSSAGEYVPRHSFRAVHKAVKEFVDFEQFRKRLQALTPGYRECLTERQREIVGYLCRLRVERLAENLLEEDELDEEG